MTTIQLSVAAPEDLLEMGIYDISGRLVRQLLFGSVGPGTHNVVWDGRNEAGMVAPNGLYFARLKTPTLEESAKLVLVK